MLGSASTDEKGRYTMVVTVFLMSFEPKSKINVEIVCWNCSKFYDCYGKLV